ncbi:MAG: hypothetical protein JWR80_4596 [Bradyrhizobium sp.]|jgi:hypothetical protein|nr:hypothetical protein [Bradyrhizobium sp.]
MLVRRSGNSKRSESLAGLWERRLKDYPASALDDLQPAMLAAVVVEFTH